MFIDIDITIYIERERERVFICVVVILLKVFSQARVQSLSRLVRRVQGRAPRSPWWRHTISSRKRWCIRFEGGTESFLGSPVQATPLSGSPSPFIAMRSPDWLLCLRSWWGSLSSCGSGACPRSRAATARGTCRLKGDDRGRRKWRIMLTIFFSKFISSKHLAW